MSEQSQSEDEYERRLVEKFLKLDKESKRLNVLADEKKKERDDAEAELLEFMDTTKKKKSATYIGIGHVTYMKPKASMAWIEDEKALFEHLRSEEIDRGDLIKESIHHSSLASYINRYLDDYNLEPPGVGYILKASLRAYPEK